MVVLPENNCESVHCLITLNISTERLYPQVSQHLHFVEAQKLKIMSSIPQGAYCAMKMTERNSKLPISIMKNAESHQSFKAYFDTKLIDLGPHHYNSKLMNSIWGFYNRYSPHNIKKSNDDTNKAFGDLQTSASLHNVSASKEVGEGSKNTKSSNQKRENLWTNIPISQSH